MCKVSTDQGPIEADEGCPDFARLVASLTRRGPSQIEFVRLEHPSGGVLTLGAKTSRDGERLLRFRHAVPEGSIHCTKRVADRRKLVSQLAHFFTTGARGDYLEWIPTKSLAFDAEETEIRSQAKSPPVTLPASVPLPVTSGGSPAPSWNVTHKNSVPALSPVARYFYGGTAVFLLLCWGLIFFLKAQSKDMNKRIEALKEAPDYTYDAMMNGKLERDGIDALKRTPEYQESAKREADKVRAEAQRKAEGEARERARFEAAFNAKWHPRKSEGHNSALGNIWPGTALYHKDTLTQFGFVVDVDSDGVWVADSYKSGASRTSLYARRYARSYITGNFVTK